MMAETNMTETSEKQKEIDPKQLEASVDAMITERVDVNNFSPMEKRVYNLTNKEWHEIEEKVIDSFSLNVWGLVQWRYCMKCRSVRPPRAHHCSSCARCVLRMDHHCPWVGNCVGLYNHKFFLNFVFHATIGCIIVMVTMATYLH